MAENVIVAEDGSLIPTGGTQVEQVGEAAHDADEAGDRTDLIVGGADPSDTFALPGDEVFDAGDVVDEDAVDAEVATPTDTGGPSITTDGSGTVDDPGSVGGGGGSGVNPAGLGVGAVALLVGVVALVAGGGDD